MERTFLFFRVQSKPIVWSHYWKIRPLNNSTPTPGRGNHGWISDLNILYFTIFFSVFPLVFRLKRYIKQPRECFITTSSKLAKNTPLRLALSHLFSLFGNVVRRCLSCLSCFLELYSYTTTNRKMNIGIWKEYTTGSQPLLYRIVLGDL